MTATFQVLGVRRHAGVSQNGKPWKMVAFSGVHTEPNGNVGVGEVVIFESDAYPAPQVEIGKSYHLTYGSRLRQGKVEATSPNLTPVK